MPPTLFAEVKMKAAEVSTVRFLLIGRRWGQRFRDRIAGQLEDEVDGFLPLWIKPNGYSALTLILLTEPAKWPIK